MNRKYKILQLVESLDTIGGMERIVAELANGLNRHEFEVEIWCIHKAGRFAHDLQKQGLTVREFKINNYYNPLNIAKLAAALRKSQADVIHTHMYFASTIGRIAGKIAGIKIIFTHVHSSYEHYNPRNLFIEKILSKMTHKVICISNNVRDFVINVEKVDPSRVVIVYNGISLVKVSPRGEIREAFRVSEGDIIITMVANLFENKGHKVLLKALSLLVERYGDIKCWIIGQGPLRQELEEYVQQLNLSQRIVFWGERYDVPQLLSASDLFILSTIRREGLAISLIEALAYKVPIIATKVGGIPEVITDKVNGLLIAPNEPFLLASAIEELLNNPDESYQYAQTGFKRFKNQFESITMVRKIESLYKEALKNHG